MGPGKELVQAAARADAVLDRIRPLLSEDDVAAVAHGRLARVLTVRRLTTKTGNPSPPLATSRGAVGDGVPAGPTPRPASGGSASASNRQGLKGSCRT
ncbi:hypothetical protein [Streptomyces sp. NPDC085540]|uniref:hypothetical protein n=1 Tax=Streptomyces sp. NPDC085540 TaxID=3365730 RepID=UPI0037D2B048